MMRLTPARKTTITAIAMPIRTPFEMPDVVISKPGW